MAYQTSYNLVPAAGFPGMIADQGPRTVISREIEGAAIGFGVPVFQGAADHGVSATGSVFRGITVLDPTVSATLTDEYAVGHTAAVLVKGPVFVRAAEPVVAGAAVFFTAAGLFSDASAGNTAVTGATFSTSGGANAVVKLLLA